IEAHRGRSHAALAPRLPRIPSQVGEINMDAASTAGHEIVVLTDRHLVQEALIPLTLAVLDQLSLLIPSSGGVTSCIARACSGSNRALASASLDGSLNQAQFEDQGRRA